MKNKVYSILFFMAVLLLWGLCACSSSSTDATGRDARYAVQLDDAPAEVFSIHEGDFTSEWRCNVLRGYATRSININNVSAGSRTLRVYLLDPGIVLQEILIK